jgi:aldose 1-epimerase
VIELSVHAAQCTISPEVGGRIATLTVHGRQLLRGPDGRSDPMTWGSYPMAPFAGRVRAGRFEFDGHDYQLELNHPPHAIHGVAFTQPWSVRDVGPTFVAMSCGLDSDHWPFGGSMCQQIELFPDRIELTLAITADDLALPAQVGWHPWFVKPDSARIEFEWMYIRDEAGIPTGELVVAPPGPWDDCFVQLRTPIELRYDDLAVQIDSDCDYWVIYDEPVDATCVEPQSGPPDGFNSVAEHAFTRLEPGEGLHRTMTISWTPIE